MKYYSNFIFIKKNLLENLGALKYNNVCAMVKANAYGVGVNNVCKTLKGKVNFFGVANIYEALEIREFDKTTPILVVGKCDKFFLAQKNNISLTLESLEDFEKMECYLNEKKSANILKIHIKINTGMNRLGFNNYKIFKKILKNLEKNQKKVYFEGIFTHFSNINDKLFSIKQFEMFKKYIKLIPNIFNPIKHIGGGDALQLIEKVDRNNFMLRVGFNLYATPNSVVNIESKIIKIHCLKQGENVGYSGAYFCNKNKKIAVVPLGYADGVNRKLSCKSFVLINGKQCRIAGNICMDMFFVDVSNVKCKIGDSVIVFNEPNTWAKICNTIPYEILTSINFKRMNYLVR